MEKLKMSLSFLAGIVLSVVCLYILDNSSKISIADPNSIFVRDSTSFEVANKSLNRDQILIRVKDYKERVNNYRNYRNGGVWRDNDKFTHTVWFDYNRITTELKNFQVVYPNVSGVRVYLMMRSKGDSAYTEDGRKEVGGRFDLFFVGTERNGTANDDIVDPSDLKFAVFGGTAMFNEGSLCPPPNPPKICNSAFLKE